MSLFRPGEFKITDRAMEFCQFKKGDRILDIGCGDGETVEYIQKKYGCQVEGLDTMARMIAEGKKRNPELNIKIGDGEFLEDYSSRTFEGINMECVLSIINLADEALHEALCVLKKGGKLMISDLYMKNPDPKQVEAIKIEAERLSKVPHSGGECSDQCADDHKARFLDFRFEGRFIKEPLIKTLQELGYKILLWEDRTPDLDTYVAETILKDGNLDNCMTCVKEKKGTGYFLLVAEKL
ncbi:MAG: class I SAM-dependent methyltransferase [Anaerovoracaceae bacterium]